MQKGGFLDLVGRVLLVCTMCFAGTAHAVDVGVLAGGACASGSESLYIYIDNEDYNSANGSTGWIGASSSTENTELRFCRINGDLLWGSAEPYMVLRLGSACPAGSTRLLRRVDAENTRDGPESSSNIPGVLVPGEASITPDVNLDFCVFPSDGYGGGSFPDLGMAYGVFASATFPSAFNRGYIYMDDEDGENYNFWCEYDTWGDSTCSSYHEDKDYWNIIGGGRNTGMNIAWVREAPPQGCSATSGGASSLSPLGLALLTIMSLRRRRSAHREAGGSNTTA